jgi:thioredoxin-related protein
MKAKKIIVLSAILIASCLSAILLYNKVQKNQKTKNDYSSIPIFQLPDLHGNIIVNNSLQSNKSTLFFDPDCGNCEEEFLQIKVKRDSLPDCNMVFVSTLPKDVILNFLKKIDFQSDKNMFFLCDNRDELSKMMDVKGLPSVLIYSKTGKLIKNYTGQVKVETLIKYLSE